MKEKSLARNLEENARLLFLINTMTLIEIFTSENIKLSYVAIWEKFVG